MDFSPNLLYATPHRQDNTYHALGYTSHGALVGTRNRSMGPPQRIDLTTYHTLNERCTIELRFAPIWRSGSLIYFFQLRTHTHVADMDILLL